MEQADDTTPRMEAEVEEALVALQKREAEIERLRQQNQRLQTERERALQRQIELEQTIIEEGGMVTLVKPLVFSPNYKPGTR
jgi:prefoldin subunit 5